MTGPRTSDTPAHLDGHFSERLKILGRAYNSLRRPRTVRERAMSSKSLKALILANKIRKRLLIVVRLTRARRQVRDRRAVQLRT